jgi:hypothetical protein
MTLWPNLATVAARSALRHIGVSSAEQQQRLAAAKAPEALKLARFFRLLAEEINLGRNQFHSIRVALKKATKDGDHVDRIYLAWSADIKLSEAPILPGRPMSTAQRANRPHALPIFYHKAKGADDLLT